MFLRNLLFLCVCVVIATGIGLYVYQSHPYLVWGLLFLCWLCFRLKLRADTLFRQRSSESVAVTTSGCGVGEASNDNNAH